MDPKGFRMNRPRRILVVYGMSYNPVWMFSQAHSLIKGFIRLGHDVLSFDYDGALRQLSMFKSKTLSKRLYKSRADHLLATQIDAYQPDIVLVKFAKALDAQSITCMRNAARKAVYIGVDNDPWPKLQRNRIETAQQLDILVSKNDGQWLQDYRDAGVPLCKFMPDCCDPDVERRYKVGDQWATDILWIGKLNHRANSGYRFRAELVGTLAKQSNCTVYGCCGRPTIGGMASLYAISGARIGVSVNAYSSQTRLSHSNRLTRFLACGVFVLQKRFAGAELLFQGDKHLKYFDETDECLESASWYLDHEVERRAIADAGMERAHKEFNNIRIAQYILDIIETGSYDAPWTPYCS